MQLIEKVTVPEGVSGDWSISRFEVTEDEAKLFNIRQIFSGARRKIVPGHYTQLKRGGAVIMSDTPAEMMDHYEFVRHASGSVLINGLGLGMALAAVLAKPGVTDVTVVELSADVIKLAGAHYSDPRVTIVHADAFEYQPPKDKRCGAVGYYWKRANSEPAPQPKHYVSPVTFYYESEIPDGPE